MFCPLIPLSFIFVGECRKALGDEHMLSMTIRFLVTLVTPSEDPLLLIRLTYNSGLRVDKTGKHKRYKIMNRWLNKRKKIKIMFHADFRNVLTIVF